METTQQMVIPLWPDGAPGSEDWDQVEEEMNMTSGLRVVRNVTQPSLTVYPAERPNGTAVIVAPGGANHFLAIEHEGRQVAKWLNERGITALILKYRLFRTGNNIDQDLREFFTHRAERDPQVQAINALNLADAQQAMRITRGRAVEWGADPQRIGFMGFSAGGGVTTWIALNYTPDTRPDFAAPIYPAVFSPVEAPVDAPPLFLLCTAGDEMASRASLWLYDAWKKVKRPVEMHIYAQGDHGFGMNRTGLPVDTWMDRFWDWMQGIGMVK